MAATAQNTNNTTIRSILQQEKLTRPNFTNWYQNLRIVLRSEGKLAHLEQPLIPIPLPVAPQAVRDTYEVLYDAQNEVACLMLGSMSPDLQRVLENYKAYDMIQELKTMFEEQAKQELFDTVKAFYACKQEYGQLVSAYILKMKGYLDTLECLGYAMPKGKIQKDKKKPQGAKGEDKGKNKLAYAPKPKIPPPPKREHPTKDSICHHCKEVGHWKRNCSSYQAELKKRKSVSIASTSGLRESRKLKHGALSLYVGNGMRAAVEAIGSFDLILPTTKESSIHWTLLIYDIVVLVINKKRIDKLQRDRVLQLTHDESLEKCKSCIFKKMARKSFPHQVERANDLLGLIHTDVCGPFGTVSREGVSYFITFTNDFNRYGYVYPMKHKHEVFETFKVFQNEVENQLDKNIKAIRSDHGGYPKEMMGYYFYYPLKNKIFVARNAELCENNLMVEESSGSLGPLESSGSDEGLELIQEEDTQPFENTSEEHNEAAPIVVEPQNVEVPIRKSARIPQAPDRYGFYVDVEEYELGDLDEPPNYKVALSDPESDKRLEAINTEMQSMKDNQV
ncbi:retrotransposon protein, putative, ty1-copia subclass [Tanacetum coccineum]